MSRGPPEAERLKAMNTHPEIDDKANARGKERLEKQSKKFADARAKGDVVPLGMIPDTAFRCESCHKIMGDYDSCIVHIACQGNYERLRRKILDQVKLHESQYHEFGTNDDVADLLRSLLE